MNDILSFDEILSGTGIPEHAEIHDFYWVEDGLQIEWSADDGDYLSDTERDRIIKDIVNHQFELVEVGAGDEFTIEEADEIEEDLRETNDDGLIDWWEGSVGEWVWSRGLDADEQLDSLLKHGEVDYGYASFRYEQPYE